MIPVLINASGGTARRLGDRCGAEVAAAFAAAGLTAKVQMLPGAAIAAEAAKHASERLVVVGGGDGTLGAAAGELARHGATLGILPLGTRNHLARELAIPLDLPGAAKLIAAGTVRRLDLARCNGAAFVNNASIGLYPQLVRERENMTLPKKLAAVPAAVRALGRMRHHRLRLRMTDGIQEVVTPMLFVGNGRYSLAAGQVGTRETLADGRLSVYALASQRRLALIGVALRTLLGRADAERDFAALGQTARLQVAGRSRHLDIALDGEVRRMAMPLDFSVDTGALAVAAPLEGEGASA